MTIKLTICFSLLLFLSVFKADKVHAYKFCLKKTSKIGSCANVFYLDHEIVSANNPLNLGIK